MYVLASRGRARACSREHFHGNGQSISFSFLFNFMAILSLWAMNKKIKKKEIASDSEPQKMNERSRIFFCVIRLWLYKSLTPAAGHVVRRKHGMAVPFSFFPVQDHFIEVHYVWTTFSPGLGKEKGNSAAALDPRVVAPLTLCRLAGSATTSSSTYLCSTQKEDWSQFLLWRPNCGSQISFNLFLLINFSGQ